MQEFDIMGSHSSSKEVLCYQLQGMVKNARQPHQQDEDGPQDRPAKP